MKTEVRKTTTKKNATKTKSAGNKTLVIVESPSKAKTINKYLGSNYIVEASVGHIKDLSKSNMGIDIENNFTPKYITIKGKADIIKKMKEDAKVAKNVLIATDPDREGEAIAWHIAEEVKKANPNIQRIVFNEITKKSVLNSINSPREINLKMFDSQQARRVIDRIIGFKISPFLSNALLEKTTAVLSAGRVQSVAVRLICEREDEINAFEPIEYWTINADFITESKDILNAKLVAFDKQAIKNPEGSNKGKTDVETAEIKQKLSTLHYIKSEDQANNLLSRIKKQNYTISDITKKQVKRRPSSPFTTSLLQQDASRKLGFASKKTMILAQRLYEGINVGADGTVGLITYMRTDSVRVSNEAIDSCRNHIAQTYGKKYLPDTPNIYASKSGNMQDAHEAIRPTTISYTPEYMRQYLDKDELLLYTLIYNRFLASQMVPALIDQTTVTITSSDNNFEFRAVGSVIAFNGFLVVYDYQNDDDSTNSQRLPNNIAAKQNAELGQASSTRSATKPPARYTEASLVKELDELGIGRPSTYATIVSTILDRNYVELQNKAFFPTELGIETNNILIDYFSNIINVDFTAQMETDLDKIADGGTSYIGVMNQFYNPFIHTLQHAEEKNNSNDNGIKCDICGGNMVIKISRRGRFLGCSNYPNCTNTKPMPSNGKAITEEKKDPILAPDNIKCDICGSPMYIREGKFGKFYGCSSYPNCNGIKPIVSNIKCPDCEKGYLVEKFSSKTKKKFWSCSNYPECKFISNREPIDKECPHCHNHYLEVHYHKTNGEYIKEYVCPKCKKKTTDI